MMSREGRGVNAPGVFNSMKDLDLGDRTVWFLYSWNGPETAILGAFGVGPHRLTPSPDAQLSDYGKRMQDRRTAWSS